MSFIDIHGHYAWNIDDGMPSYEDARKALELARENRISAIVATPHVTPGVHTKDDIHDFIQRIDDLRMLATEYNIDILDGCELFLNHDYQKALDQNLFIPIENTQYVLVEFDVRKEIGNEQEIEERLSNAKVVVITNDKSFDFGFEPNYIIEIGDSKYKKTGKHNLLTTMELMSLRYYSIYYPDVKDNIIE